MPRPSVLQLNLLLRASAVAASRSYKNQGARINGSVLGLDPARVSTLSSPAQSSLRLRGIALNAQPNAHYSPSLFSIAARRALSFAISESLARMTLPCAVTF